MASSFHRPPRKRRLGHAQTIPIDLDSSEFEYIGDPISKHRTCWMHVQSYLRAHRKRIPKKRFDDIKLCAPCLLSGFPRAARSKRGECKRLISRLKKKLDTETFNCYLEFIWSSFSEHETTAFACLDSLWFASYMERTSKEKVLSWIKRKQIFSMKYVFVPIVRWSHWSLLILCHFGESLQSTERTPCMLLLDSLEMTNPRRLEPEIRKFVLDIYRAEGRPGNKETIGQIPLLVPKVPQQRDDEECGRFVLYFINLFVKDAPKDFSMEGYPYFMKKDWFNPEALDRFCEERLESVGR